MKDLREMERKMTWICCGRRTHMYVHVPVCVNLDGNEVVDAFAKGQLARERVRE